MKKDRLSDYVTEIAKKLDIEAKATEENRETHYVAAKLLRLFNELFEPDWHDLHFAEQMVKDREEDKRNGRPWLGDDDT